MTTEKIGRVRRCRLGPRRLDAETAWIADYRRMLEARLNRLGEFRVREGEKTTTTTEQEPTVKATPLSTGCSR